MGGLLLALWEINGAIHTPGRREQPPAPAADGKCATFTDSCSFPEGWGERKGRMEGQEGTMRGF